MLAGGWSAAVIPVGLCAGFVPVGVLLLRRRPVSALAVLVAAVGVFALGWTVSLAARSALVASWALQWLWLPTLLLAPAVLLLFPDSPRHGRRARIALVLVSVATVATVALAVAALWAPRSLITGGTADLPALARVAMLIAAVGAAVCVLATLPAMAALGVRAIRRRGVVRRQISCLLPAATLLPLGVLLDVAGVPLATLPGQLALPAGIGVAVLQFGLDDLDLLVDRRLITAGFWTVIGGAFVAVVVLVGLAAGGRPSPLFVLGCTAAAVGFAVLSAPACRLSERWLYGERDPAGVLRSLGSGFVRTTTPTAMLGDAMTTLTRSLKLPSARVVAEFDDDPQGPRLLAAAGREWIGGQRFPLVHGGRRLGYLEAAPRRTGESFRRVELAVLGDVARECALIVDAYRLTLELQRSREHLVVAREEERLRLRNDLHDGLGPMLAGARMQLSAARSRLGDSRERDLVESVIDDLTDAAASVRGLIDGLRPAVLDQGLATAVADTARGLLPQADVVLRSDDLAGLPAAVEVAAYRIVTEAVTNVARHAEATRCVIELNLDSGLTIRVVDDGRGLPDPVDDLDRPLGVGGVGLSSMAARAEELGGTLRLDSDGRGTMLAAHLPLPH